jgi:uncharacterized protein YjbI with pentapeptide repeats
MRAEEFLRKLTDKAEFIDVTISDADIAETTAYDVRLTNCTFIRCTMVDNCWEGLQAQGSSFLECDFRRSNFEDAVFTACTFFPADASEGCNFMHARLRSARFTQCRLSSGIFEGADLLWSTIEDSEAVGAKFFKAHFNGAVTLTRNIFKYADLRGADF